MTIWTPENGLAARERDDAAPYTAWVAAGHIQTVPGGVMDYDAVARWVAGAMGAHDLAGLAYDPWRIGELVRELGKHGIECHDTEQGGGASLAICGHPQGFMRRGKTGLSMPESLDHIERLMHTRRVTFADNPAVRSAILGAVVIADASGNRRLHKMKSATRIDAALAAVMALGYACQDASRPVVMV